MRTKTITMTGVAAALVFAATFFVRFPTPLGYLNAGDGVILLAGLLLGGLPGAVAAVLGSALADVAAGYAVYAPITAAVKGLMGFWMGRTFEKGRRPKRLFLCLVAAGCELVMVAGYFLFEWGCTACPPPRSR